MAIFTTGPVSPACLTSCARPWSAPPLLCCISLLLLGCRPASSPPGETGFAPRWAPGLPQSAYISIERIHDAPVLSRGQPERWDDGDVLNPSVVRFNGKLFNYYSGFDGAVWRTGIAESVDGIAWTKWPGNPVLEPGGGAWDTRYIAANGSALVRDGKVLYFYQGMDREGRTQIGLSTSTDGYHLRKEPAPVFTPGAPGAWDAISVADPFVMEINGWLYLYYLGQDDVGVQRLGLARSRNGSTWERFPGNPLLDVGAAGSFDEGGLGEPSIAWQPPFFYMVYTGRAANEVRNIGYAISADGTHWKKMSATGLIADDQRGAWFSKVVCDTTLVHDRNNKWWVWFGGGDSAQPAENLNGQIGLLTLDLGQDRALDRFNANDDWKTIGMRTQDVLLGSYEIEGDPGNRSVWVGPRARIYLVRNDSAHPSVLVIEGWSPASLIAKTTGTAGPQTITLVINSAVIYRRSFSENAVFTLRVPWSDIVKHIGAEDNFELEILVDRSMVPAHYQENGDLRELALKLTRIEIQ